MERTWVLDDDIGVELNQTWNCLTFRLLIWENKLLYYLSYFNLGLWLFDWSTRVLLPVQKKQLPSSSPSHAISAASALHGSPGCCCGWPSAATIVTSGDTDPAFDYFISRMESFPLGATPVISIVQYSRDQNVTFHEISWEVGGLRKRRTCAQ